MESYKKDSTGKPIKGWRCTRKECGYTTDQATYNVFKASAAHVNATGGHFGPNGNGYNYWCPKCNHRMDIIGNEETNTVNSQKE
jgi:hypothetical protein